MDNSHSGLSHLTGEYLFQFSLSLSNIWLRYNKKPKGMFFYETQCILGCVAKTVAEWHAECHKAESSAAEKYIVQMNQLNGNYTYWLVEKILVQLT